jgi:hypothetical protein
MKERNPYKNKRKSQESETKNSYLLDEETNLMNDDLNTNEKDKEEIKFNILQKKVDTPETKINKQPNLKKDEKLDKENISSFEDFL